MTGRLRQCAPSATGGGTGGGTTTTFPCANHSYQCVDATGVGDYLCLDPTTTSGFPASAPTCASSATCATNYGCWATTGAATGQCLQNCVPGTGGGSGSSTCTTDTWANYGQSFFSSQCMSGCHQHTGEFTAHSTVQSRASALVARIQYNMPPAGLTTAQQNRIVKYLNCGAP